VVADEVRNLAQRCAQADKDTAALIEESIAKSNDGKVKVDQVAMAIRAITEESAKVKTLVDEVSLSSVEQTRGIEQVAKAITQMEQVTQNSAASAEEGASAAEELTAQSEAMKDVVERLSAMVGGVENGGRAVQNRVPRSPERQMAPASRRHAPSGAALSALSKAIGTEFRGPEPRVGAMSAITANRPDRNAFPLEEDFKETL